MKRRKIAIMLPCLLTGGTEVATLDTLRVFVRLGFTVDVIVYFDEVDLLMLESFATEGGNLVLLGLRRYGGRTAQARLAAALVRQLLIGRYYLIWLQYMTPTLLPLVVARFFTFRLASCIHVAASHYNAQGLRRIRWMARHWLTRFVCVSHTVANGIFGEGWKNSIYSRKIAVIPNSIDPSKVDTAAPRGWRDEAGWPENRVIVGYCGRLATIKGVDILLKAVGNLLVKGHDIGVVLVGEGEQRVLLESLGTKLGFGKRLYFAGRIPRDEIYAAIKGFDITVVPSREEGFGLSALESMAAGTTLIASDAGALPEIVIGDETGLLFRAGSAPDLAKRLLELLGQPILRDQLAVASKRHVAEKYSIAGYQRRLADLIESL